MNDLTIPGAPTSSGNKAGLINRRNALKTIAGAAAVGGLTQRSSQSANATVRSDTASLDLLDKMATKPTTLAMQPRTYEGRIVMMDYLLST